MTSLSSSWHSSSLTFVSSQNHQQPTAASRPLTAAHQRRRLSCPGSTMAKIVTLTVALVLVMIVVGMVLAEEDGVSPASTGRGRGKSLRKKKVSESALARLRTEESTTVPTTLEEGGGGGGTGGNEEPGPVTATAGGTNNEELLGTSRRTTTTTRPTRAKKPSRSQQAQLNRSERPSRSNGPVPEGCGDCNTSLCRNQRESDCHVGLVMDRCSCCMVCGIGEGSRCFNSTISNVTENPDVGMCGTGLACLLRKDLDANEPLEALCECRDRRLVCGNDNETYISECKLRETAHRSPGLSIASWGPCVSAPRMPSSVENVTLMEGDDASLSCEVKGFPSPIIHWEFLSVGSLGAPIILPGDDSSVVVTVRGGPEQLMTTSWIQIIAVSHERQGTYYCVATNPKGVARSSAAVIIAVPGSSSQEEENAAKQS